MLLLKLSPSQIEMFDKAPEAGMGFHFARIGEQVGFILSSRVLMLVDFERQQSDALCQLALVRCRATGLSL